MRHICERQQSSPSTGATYPLVIISATLDTTSQQTTFHISANLDANYNTSQIAMENTGLSTDNSMSGMDQQTQCGLFRLPRELRDMIYHHVVGTGLFGRRLNLQNAQALAPRCPLTLTCRRIHDEVSPIHQATYATYWASNVFVFTLTDVFDERALSTKRIEHMTCIMRRRELDDSNYEIRELRSDTSHGYWNLELQHSSPRPAIDGQTGYQIAAEYRKGGAWRSVRVFSSKTGRWHRTWA